ncbi:carbohydrate-binding family 9 [Candidatus Vecturithrix granuli]|uniref:Carbohydrate-binding family 9 n=1 Tax=Vecturithrix granuli TaxID=1499967 RepID=A0A0S6W6A1_VECG1|nr:carbohydrate-binding family 9 [Candidatus Vecturithrix granuli]
MKYSICVSQYKSWQVAGVSNRKIAFFMPFWLLFGLLLHLSLLTGTLVFAAVRSMSDPAVMTFIEQGKFDPQQISENDLLESLQAAYREFIADLGKPTPVPSQEGMSERVDRLGERLLRLKWWRLWDADFEMDPETVIVTDPLPPYFRPAENWQWADARGAGQPRWHYGNPEHNTARHRLQGVLPSLLPVNGTLLQEVFFPEDTLPDQIWLHIETKYVGSTHPEPTQIVQVRWTKTPEEHFRTENRPDNFWAGVFDADSSKKGGIQTLTVNLLDLGLCGRERSILGIEFVAVGGQAWFGRTIIRRPQVEIRGSKPYHIFSERDKLQFDLIVHNFLPAKQQYTLNLKVSDYDGVELLDSTYDLEIPKHANRKKTLTLKPEGKRYLVFEYTLSSGGQTITQGYSAAAVIIPTRSGRDPYSKFGMMYWDHPGQQMVTFFEQLGVKLVVMFPDLERLHLFDPHKFDIMPMFWMLPERNPVEAAKLQQEVQPYLQSEQRMFSNFWETDLRVPAAMFAPNMQTFCRIIKALQPSALVGVGGLAWFNVAYLNQLLQFASNAPPYFDFIAMMLYNTPSPPEYSGIERETDALRTLIERSGKSQIELWNVEWSYFEGLNLDGQIWLNTCVPRKDVAAYTLRHHLLGFAAGIDRMIPGSSIYAGRMPLSKNYGHSMVLGGSSMIRYDQTPLPLLPAYSTMTRLLEGKHFVKNLSRHPNVICQVYQGIESAKIVIVLWSLFGKETVTFAFPQKHTGQEMNLTLLNMIGESSQLTTFQGKIGLSISPEPTYILLPEGLSEHLDALEMSVAEPMFTMTPEIIEVVPGKKTTAALSCRLFNPGMKPLQGVVRLTPPTGVRVLDSKVVYADLVGEELAAQFLKNSQRRGSADFVSQEIWLGRQREVDVFYTLEFSEALRRNTYYEQAALTAQSEIPLKAELLVQHQLVAQAAVTVRILPPLQVRLRPLVASKHALNTPGIQVQVVNTSAVPREGAIRLKTALKIQAVPHQQSFTLLPGQSQTYNFSLSLTALTSLEYTLETVDTRLQRKSGQITLQVGQPAPFDHYQKQNGYLFSFGVGEGYPIEALVRDQKGYEDRQLRGFAFRPAVKAKTPITIDGNLDEWRAAAPLFVHPENRLSGLTFFARDYGAEMQWQGLADFSAAWQMLWDDRFLYLAVKVFDDQIVPVHALGSFWNGDTVSFQIDPLPDDTDASILPQQRDLRAIHTFEMGLSQQGPVIRRLYATHNTMPGVVTTTNLAIVPQADGPVYELALPWAELAPLRPSPGVWLGLSLVFSEDDGYGRETQINWFGGSNGNGLAREPRLMGDVHLVE